MTDSKIGHQECTYTNMIESRTSYNEMETNMTKSRTSYYKMDTDMTESRTSYNEI